MIENHSKVVVFLGAVILSAVSFAGDTAGHGGDGIRFLFRSAKDAASLKVMKYMAKEPRLRGDRGVHEWIVSNADALSIDIMKTEHQWVDGEESKTCALTALHSKAPLKLSYANCKDSSADLEKATKVLIHESVHHFGIADELFADAVADHIYRNTPIEYQCTFYRGWLKNMKIVDKRVISEKEIVASIQLTDSKYRVNVEYNYSYIGAHVWSMVENKAVVKSYNYATWGAPFFYISDKELELGVKCELVDFK